MISLQKESGESTQKVNFRIKETKKISVFKKWQNRLYKVGFGWNFFKSEIIKGNSPSLHSHYAFRASKRDCESVEGEEGENIRVLGSLQVRDPSRLVRDLLGGARPVQQLPAVRKHNGCDPSSCVRPVQGCARPVHLPASKTTNKFPPSSSNLLNWST